MAADLELTLEGTGLIDDILNSVVVELNRVFSIMKPALEQKTAELLRQRFIASQEYASLESNEKRSLHGELGITSPQEKLQAIIDEICKNVKVEIQQAIKTGQEINGGMSIKFLVQDFSDVLALKEALQDTGKGDLPWLEWLLTKGDTPIIEHRFYLPGNFPTRVSRTGLGVMAKGNQKSWSLTQYSGTVEDNWLTRCFKDTETEIANLTLALFQENFQWK